MPSSTRGSSPLTRGKRRAARGRLGCSRLIPAHAGKTTAEAPPTGSRTAHPRSRGENPPVTCRSVRRRGSSPLTRGKLRLGDNRRAGRGLIPAHAGKTSVNVIDGVFPRAHPRSRGENSGASSGLIRANGSSPLTRGKPETRRTGATSIRLIPAHAGKTPSPRAAPPPLTAHPRSRGENYATKRNLSRPSGSSPLTRGKHVDRPNPPEIARLIPAHAGKTMSDALASVKGTAHPRSRGENGVADICLMAFPGSSPLTRGKRTG